MRIDLYLGPSLDRAERDRLVAEIPADVRVLPPVRQGDLIRGFSRLPDVIAIADGVFFQAPSVYHKEILAAIDRGAWVVGSSSMGALRAAELDRYGMHGVGEVYRLYRRGVIDGDDMVALAHAEADEDFRPLSVPLVNIRHNLLAAARRGVLEPATARRILRGAAALFFPARTWSSVLGQARMDGVDGGALEALRAHLRDHEVDLKRDDTVALLKLLARHAATGQRPAPARHDPTPTPLTTYFSKIISNYAGHELDGRHLPTSLVVGLQRLLDERFADLVQRINQRCVAIDQAREAGLRPPPADDLLARFPPWRALHTDTARDRWLRERYLTRDELVAAIEERDLEDRVTACPGGSRSELAANVSARTGLRPAELRRRLLAHPGVEWDGPLVRELKVSGAFGPAMRLAKLALDANDAFDAKFPSVRGRLTDDGLAEWFAGRWGVAVADLTSALRGRGFTGWAEFLELGRIGYVYDWLSSRREQRSV